MAKRVSNRDKLKAMRVAVAEDVLQWIDVADIEQGSYIDVKDGQKINDVSGDMRECWGEVVRKCQVCHLGAGLVAKARLMDKVPMADVFGDNSSGDTVHRHMDAIYGERTAQLMESAFEGLKFTQDDDSLYDDDGSYRGVTDAADDVQAAIEFGKEFDDDRERSRAIWQEVIRQKGHFDPEKALAYLKAKKARARTRKAAAR